MVRNDMKNWSCGMNLSLFLLLAFGTVTQLIAQSSTELRTLARQNLGDKVNSKYSDYAPVISPDGETLYFVRNETPENVAGTEDVGDIWVSRLVGGVFQTAVNLKSLNNVGFNSVESMTPDGNKLLVTNRYQFDRSYKPGGYSLARRGADGWEVPEPLIIPNLNTHSPFMEACLSPDGKSLLITLQRDDGFGEHDIYISHLDSLREWSEPINCGSINTAGNEMSPFLAADNATLYFASSGRGGLGNHDIFMSRRLDSTWANWSKPENLGNEINSEGDDAYISITANGEYIYFSSSQTTVGGSDVFRMVLPPPVRPRPVVLVKGKVLDKKTNKPLSAEVHYELLPSGEEVGVAVTNPITGEYQIALPAGELYGFRAQCREYFHSSENIDLTDLKKFEELKRDFRLTPIEINASAQLGNIFFEFGSSNLAKASYPEIKRIVGSLTENPEMVVEIGGHTDNVGSDDANLRMSQRRAEAVRVAMINSGADGNRVLAKGYGKSKPVVPNTTDVNRSKNRRVEVSVLKLYENRVCEK